MGAAFLPTGRIVNNPDSVKLVKIIRTEAYGKTNCVVAVKLDDDSELVIESGIAREEEALALADKCIDLINSAAQDEFDYGDGTTSSGGGGDDDDDDDDDDADDDDADDDDGGDDDDDDDGDGDGKADAGGGGGDDDDWDDDSW